jgi:lysophospholipase L1-like esterase
LCCIRGGGGAAGRRAAGQDRGVRRFADVRLSTSRERGISGTAGKGAAGGIEVLLCGMLAAPNLGPEYARAFNAIYSDLASANSLLFYPFFLDGIAVDAKFNQRDGLHPTELGVAAIVERIMPKAQELVTRARAKRGS